jgi:hypothetical protein
VPPAAVAVALARAVVPVARSASVAPRVKEELPAGEPLELLEPAVVLALPAE